MGIHVNVAPCVVLGLAKISNYSIGKSKTNPKRRIKFNPIGLLLVVS
jgi:hypothetical protein